MKWALAAMFCLPALVWGDEIILKDGKTIVWKSIVSKEDGYEVVTQAGETLTLKKDQIAKITAGPAKPEAPLTGAFFTFKKSKPINLLPLIDVKTDGLSEGWTMPGGVLVATGNYLRTTKLQISNLKDIPQEYDLSVTVERPDAVTTDFTIVLPGFTGKQFLVSFDADTGLFSGVGSINGQGVSQGPAKVPGIFLKKGNIKTITIMVRQEAVIVMVDGKDFLAWKAEWDKISLPAGNALANEKTIGFMLYHYGSYKISRIVLTAGPR